MSGVDAEREIRREHDSVDDFEHLEHDVQDLRGQRPRVQEARAVGEVLDQAAIAQPCPREMEDPKQASLLLVHAETESYASEFAPEKLEAKLDAKLEAKPGSNPESKLEDKLEDKLGDKLEEESKKILGEDKEEVVEESLLERVEEKDIRESVLPVPEKSPTLDFLGDRRNVDDSWNVVERNDGASRPLNTSPQDADVNNLGSVARDVDKGARVENVDRFDPPGKPDKPDKFDKLEKLDRTDKTDRLEKLDKMDKLDKTDKMDKADRNERFEMSNEFVFAEAPRKGQGSETGESEFESEAEASPARTTRTESNEARSVAARGRIEEIEIAPKEIFKSMGIDAWFNPERLNPKVAALIYWREPRKSGIVFASILAVLLSLASTSLISVLAYISLLVLTGTVGIRIYKTVLQAVQKTSDGHPFKDALSLDLTLPSEKVHQVADVAVAHANAAVSELRRLFLVEDFVDSVKFGVLLWCLTYVGSWFNGLTLIIIGVVALFTLPKVYETNKAQIDQNLALVQGKINELTAKVRAAIPLGKKPEPTKEE